MRIEEFLVSRLLMPQEVSADLSGSIAEVTVTCYKTRGTPCPRNSQAILKIRALEEGFGKGVFFRGDICSPVAHTAIGDEFPKVIFDVYEATFHLSGGPVDEEE